MRHPARGFTLVEVLVALTVLAVALGALVKAVGNQGESAAYLRDRTFAHWVAEDVLTEAQLLGGWPDTGRSSGTRPMAGHEWHWTRTVANTEDPMLRRMDVAVRLEKDDETPLVQVTGFIGEP